MSTLVYLSCPFGGKLSNLHKAITHLAWAHANTPWGLWVQAPWIASAMAELQRGTTEPVWRAMGGVQVEERVLDGFDALLLMGVPFGCPCSTGQLREARYMAGRDKSVYMVVGMDIVDATWNYR